MKRKNAKNVLLYYQKEERNNKKEKASFYFHRRNIPKAFTFDGNAQAI